MSLKPCSFTIKGVKGELSYDQMREQLYKDKSLWADIKISKTTKGQEAVVVKEKVKPTEEIKVKDATIKLNKSDNDLFYTIIQNESGNEIGNIGIKNNGDYYEVQKTKINDYAQGKGYGKESYIKIAESLDKPLYSDKDLTTNAKKLWESLVKDGIAEKFNENGKDRYRITKEEAPKKEAPIEEAPVTKQEAVEDVVGEVVSGTNLEDVNKSLEVLVEQESKEDEDGKSEYQEEHPKEKTFAQALAEDVRNFLTKGSESIKGYSKKAQDFIASVSKRIKASVVGVAILGMTIPGINDKVSAYTAEYGYPTMGEVYEWTQRLFVKLGVAEIETGAKGGKVDTKTVMDSTPETVVIRPENGKATSTPVSFKIRGLVPDYLSFKAKSKLWMYVRDADNGKLTYVAGPHRHNMKAYGKNGVQNIEGVGHFMISPDDLTTMTSNATLDKIKKALLAEIAYAHPNNWIPTFKRIKGDTVALTFKKLGDVTKDDLVSNQLVQLRGDEIDWNAKRDTPQFKDNVFALASKFTGKTCDSFLFAVDHDYYNRFSGGSFFIIAETPNGVKVREMSGNLAMLKMDIDNFAKLHNIGLDKISVAAMDAGSYSGKPVAGANKSTKFADYKGYNVDVGASSLNIPAGGEVQFRKGEVQPTVNSLGDSVADIVNQMNAMTDLHVETDLSDTLETRGSLDDSSALKRKGVNGKLIKAVKIEDFAGKRIMVTISDELTTSEEVINPITGEKIPNLKGGLYFNYSGGNEGFGWAYTDKATAQNVLNVAKEMYAKNPEMYPDGIVPVAVVKMGKKAMISNEAVVRQFVQNVSGDFFPQENKAKAFEELKKEIPSLLKALQDKEAAIEAKNEALIAKAKAAGKEVNPSKLGSLTASESGELRGYKDIIALIGKSKSFDDLISSIDQLKIGTRPLLVARITKGNPSEPPKNYTWAKVKEGKKEKTSPVLMALLEGLPKDAVKRIHLAHLVDVLTEPSLKNVPDRHIMSFVGIDATADAPVESNHPNYKYALLGKGLGVLKNTIHLAGAMGTAYASSIKKLAVGIQEDIANSITTGVDKVSISVAQAISRGMPAALNNIIFKNKPIEEGLSNFNKLIAALNLAFPSVEFFTDETSWNEVMESDGVKKFLSKGEVVYGLTVDGKIYLNPEMLDTNTPIHEMGHIWIDMIEQSNSKLFNKGLDLIKGTKELAAAEAQYGKGTLKSKKEALAILIGNKGETIVSAAQQSKFKEWLAALFVYVTDKFPSLGKLKPAQIEKLTLEDFINGAVRDLLSGESMEEGGPVYRSSEVEFSKGLSKELNADIRNALNTMPFKEAIKEIEQLLRDEGVDPEDIAARIAEMEERHGAKTEAEYFADHINALKAAAKLSIPQARELMKHFKTFLGSEEALQDAMDFVDRLVKQKDLLATLNKTKEAFKKMKKLRNNKKLTVADKELIANLAVPRFYLLEESDLIKLREMALDFVDSRLNQKPSKYTAAEIDAAYNEAATKMPAVERAKSTRRITTATRAVMELSVKDALNDVASELPIAKELAGMNLSMLDKAALNKIMNALRVYDETGKVFHLGDIVETVKALNDVKKIQNSGVIANIKKLAAGGISARLQSIAANADEIRKILVGGWDRNAGRVTAETQKMRELIDKKFRSLNITPQNKFDLGTYSFFKEISKNQSIEQKASVLAAQMNGLKEKIKSAKAFNSDAQKIAEYEHYYNGSTEALSSLGIIKEIAGVWTPVQNIDINTIEANVPNNVKEAWAYSQGLLEEKTEEYANNLALYHGKDLAPIVNYSPRSFMRTDVKKSDLLDPTSDLPPMGSIDPVLTKQQKEVTSRVKGRKSMPKTGGFYVLDGYSTLMNGLWDINSVIDLSKTYAYTNALVNKGNITSDASMNAQIKQYIISSVSGILRDPMVFPDTRAFMEKTGSFIFNTVTTTILNNFTQVLKQPQALWQTFTANPSATMQAMGLMSKSMTDPKLAEALDKFFKNTSEPYATQLSYIEMENRTESENKYVRSVESLFDKIKPDYLVRANRFTQRVLLLSGYLGNKKVKDFVAEANAGFNENALAAGENNAEAANSTANRHFLPLQLKEAKSLKKFLYFLGTYNFVVTSQFWNNFKIWQGAGYTSEQKSMAIRQITGLMVQQVMFQIATRALTEGVKAIGRELDWLEEEDEEKRRERWGKYLYQVPTQVIVDLLVGPMIGLVGDSIKTAVVSVSELIQDKLTEDTEEEQETLDLLFKRKNEYPGVYGVLIPTIETLYKSATSEDEKYKISVVAQFCSMMLSWGDAFYFSRLKATAQKNILDTAKDDVLREMRSDDPQHYKQWVNDIREQGVSDKYLSKMSWKDGDIGYYVTASDAGKFKREYDKVYNESVKDLTLDNKGVSSEDRLTEKQIKSKSSNLASLEAQASVSPKEFKITKEK